ncbi:NAD(P)/FAD-dependent oxidoreductase [Roseibium aggregatum]|uniref:FAD-dependent oxidoreductase n=1 Tax=Roseibium aggregatum TaxID=187304 RepID=A0A926P0D7_9HYPH|nr:FAD-dependent oxidoreductase [Roseibium aggregatum]MBD1546995.1 FAD-dependent oxidoreductase [Roseibium aggregatum]
MTDPILIVGAGQASIKAAETLRQKGYDGDLVLFGDEAFLPYQRPPLSKAYLKGEMDEERLFLRPEAYFEAAFVELRTRTSVTSIDPAAKSIALSDGTRLPYSSLLLATGTRARQIPLEGAALEGVFSLRTMADVAAIRASLNAAENVVILGGGYIGMEFAAVAAGLGKTVTVIEACRRVMERSVAPEISTYFQNLHRAHGVTLRLEQKVERLTGETTVTGAALGDGTQVPADLVLLAVGAVPVTELAQSAGLAVGSGITVDKYARTSAPGIYAAGDCTEFPSARYGRSIRLESVQNAIDQARIAAGSMLGETEAYDPVPWFWSDQYDAKLQIAALSSGYDRTEIEGDYDGGRFALRYFQGDRLLAVDTVNAPRDHMMARKLLARTGPDRDGTPANGTREAAA